ncbi:MAG: NADPH-dependent glutamate synthase [bacterium]
MSYRIVTRRMLTSSIILLEIEYPLLARSARPGNFVVIKVDEYGERIPLTIADRDEQRGTITVIFQIVGASTRKLALLRQGDTIMDLVGPLGKPTHIYKTGTVVCVGGGVGVAPVLPIAKAMKEIGNRVISIIGARNKDTLILEDEMRAISDRLMVATDDGSHGTKGFVTDLLAELIDRKEKIDLVVAIGPVVMMREVAKATKRANIPTVVSLNSIMVDATGMCGACRVSVDNRTLFACVEGPEFDGHKVDFDELLKRHSMYRREEDRALWNYTCKCQEKEARAESANQEDRPKTRVPMPMQNPAVRIRNFEPVALGYKREQALMEASRCLECKNKPCVEGCPVDIDIPSFIRLIKKEDFAGAIRKIKEKNSLPAICGRVCPQESQCEARCTLNKKGQPIAIGRLERFVADYEYCQGNLLAHHDSIPRTGKKVAVIGSGPAGLTAASELARMGHEVTVFEALHKAGGVLIYGIPEFRLPKAIVQREIDYIRELGVEVKTNHVVGKLITVDQLRQEGFDAVFIGTGAGLPSFMNIPGENLNGVYTANEFLTRANLMKAYLFPDYDTPIRIGAEVAVIGGGNVAMDSARVALRLGAEKVYVIYRRSMKELPARWEEVENAKEEGIEFWLLSNPTRILDNGNGWVKGIECIRTELAGEDQSGRRRPVPVPGSEYILDVQAVVVAIGQGPNLLLTSTMTDLALNKKRNIIADELTGATNLPGIYAGGDIVTGAATVIKAMGAGKKAAQAIHAYLLNKEQGQNKSQ